MKLVAKIIDNKSVSKWFEYKDDNGNVVAKFKVKNIGNKQYRVAEQRALDQVMTKGFDVGTVSAEDQTYNDLLRETVAHYLIEDWSGISFQEVIDGIAIEKEAAYSVENAKTLLKLGDIGIIVWHFVRTKAEELQQEIDAELNDTLGKLSYSTNGQSTEATKKPTSTRVVKKQSVES